MPWVVDTCVLIDILRGDNQFAVLSAAALQSKLHETLTIAPLTYVELSPEFNGDATAQNEFLDSIWVHRDFGGNGDAVLEAHRAWNEHVLRKRSGLDRKRPIADILIGAYALTKGGLITRNESDFRALYPSLRILNPIYSTTTTPI